MHKWAQKSAQSSEQVAVTEKSNKIYKAEKKD